MDAWINPNTRDYAVVAAQAGAVQRAPGAGLANACYLRLMTPLGSWFGDKTLGSRLHELQREKDLARVERLTKQYATAALQPLVDDGRLVNLMVQTERIKDASLGGRLGLSITGTDSQSANSVFNLYVKVV